MHPATRRQSSVETTVTHASAVLALQHSLPLARDGYCEPENLDVGMRADECHC